jgi:hypothetical protein
LQQAPKIPESAKIMKNQATEPIVAYSLLSLYLISFVASAGDKNKIEIIFFDICCCHNSKRKEATLSILFQIVTTTKLKTKNFGFLVFSH